MKEQIIALHDDMNRERNRCTQLEDDVKLQEEHISKLMEKE